MNRNCSTSVTWTVLVNEAKLNPGLMHFAFWWVMFQLVSFGCFDSTILSRSVQMTTIAVFVGSLRKDSFNKKLARGIERLLPADVTFQYVDMDLPLYNQDIEGDLPAKVQELKQTVEHADGVLFVTPEYNRGYPGVLKNAIDWGSRPWGQSSFAGKPAAIVGASAGVLGTSQSQAALRNVALFLDMKLMGQPEVYFNASTGLDEQGNLADNSVEFIRKFAEAFAQHVQENS